MRRLEEQQPPPPGSLKIASAGAQCILKRRDVVNDSSSVNVSLVKDQLTTRRLSSSALSAGSLAG